MVVQYVIRWSYTNHESCQHPYTHISTTFGSGSSSLGDEVYDWC
ncbi:T8F5.3 [Arabidopsis thaliana]|uniref:T8F5.3 n=1 Tax=Arabidopsis thaliana TaxID=3702 RepID=O80797_ARATH|nr:T8F5.3 [Arabidopsis thaliana]